LPAEPLTATRGHVAKPAAFAIQKTHIQTRLLTRRVKTWIAVGATHGEQKWIPTPAGSHHSERPAKFQSPRNTAVPFFNFAFLIFNCPYIFILPENNTFSPNRVGRRPLRPGAAMVKVKNHQCLQGLGCTGRAVLGRGGNHPKTGFHKKQNFGNP